MAVALSLGTFLPPERSGGRMDGCMCAMRHCGVCVQIERGCCQGAHVMGGFLHVDGGALVIVHAMTRMHNQGNVMLAL